MGKQFTILMENTTISAAATLIIARPSSTVGFKVLRAWANQSDGVTSAQVRIELGRKASAFGTYTSTTPRKLDERNVASAIVGGTSGAAGTCGVAGTTEGGGTFTPVFAEGFNNIIGFEWVAVAEEFVFEANSAEGFVMRFPLTPSPTPKWDAGIVIEEL